MALKVLGQSAPSANTDTTLYTVGSGLQAVVSTLTICNRGTTDARVRVAIRPAGAAIAVQHYLYFDTLVPARDTLAATLGLSLAATDVVTVRTDTAAVTFCAFGDEVAA